MNFPANLVQYELAVERELDRICNGRCDVEPPQHRELNEAFFARREPHDFAVSWVAEKRIFGGDEVASGAGGEGEEEGTGDLFA